VYRVSKDGSQSSPERLESFSSWKPHSLAIVPSKPLECRSEALSLSSTTTLPTSTPSSLMSTTDWVPAEMDEGVTDDWGEATIEGACHNFCLGQNTSCFIRESGPECECPESRSGSRCEVDPCKNFCLQHSTGCRIVEGAPECFCPAGWSGDRCQLQDQDSNIPQTTRDVVVPLLNVSVADLNILVVSLSATSFILLLLTGALALVVFRLKQRPRIVRKRFISTSPPPVPSKTSCGGEDAGDGVRLDIEDCCNMTLCDTPCFEPPTRGPKKSAGRRTGGCQDKRSLLSNQDDDSLDF